MKQHQNFSLNTTCSHGLWCDVFLKYKTLGCRGDFGMSELKFGPSEICGEKEVGCEFSYDLMNTWNTGFLGGIVYSLLLY